MSTCTIRILDEVNCKCENLDVATRRKCANALSYILPWAYHSDNFRLGRWDGKLQFFSVGGATQLNLLPKVLSLIEEAGYDIEIVDERKSYDFQFDKIDENIVSDCKWPDNHSKKPNQPIILEEHQVRIINNFFDNLQSVQNIAVNAGKTITIAVMSKIIEKYGRTIIIVPSKNLVEQTLKEYQLLNLDVGIYYGDEKEWNKKHTICTWQSLDILTKNTKNNTAEDKKTIHDFIDGVTAVIVDEAHNVGKNLRSLLTGIFRNVPIRLGLTGTIPPEEISKINLVSSIGEIFHGIATNELQEKGISSWCEVEIIQTQEQNKFNNYQDELKFLTSNTKRLTALAELFKGIAEDGNTLILVNRIETGEQLQELIPGSVFLEGKIKTSKRQEEYDLVATQDDRIIIATFGIASTGINVPRVKNIIIFEPGKSYIKVIQSIGRVLRRALDKDFAKIYDICSATKYSKRHLTERKKHYKQEMFPFHITKLDLN